MPIQKGLRVNNYITESINVIFCAEFSVMLILSAWAYSFWPTLVSIYNFNISNPANVNIIAVLAATLAVAFFKRKNLARISPYCAQFGLVLLFCLTTWWGFAFVKEHDLLQQLSVILIIPAIIYTATGAVITKNLFFPLMLLIFALPWGPAIYMWARECMVYFLQNFSGFSELAKAIQNTMLDSITSGLFYIVHYIFLGNIIACIMFSSLGEILFITSFFAIFPIIFTLISVFIVGIFGNIINYISIYSWLAVISGIIVSFILTFILRHKKLDSRIFPAINLRASFATANFHWFTPTLIACGIILIIPWFAANVKDNPWNKKHGEILLYAPYYLPDWKGPFRSAPDAWQPSFPGATKTVLAAYKNEQAVVYLYTAYFASSRDINSLISKDNTLYDKKLWDNVAMNVRTITIKEGIKLTLREEIIQSGANKRLLWSWYYVGTFTSANYDLIDLLDKVKIISNIADHAGVVAFSTDFDQNLEIARVSLQKFLLALYPQIQILMNPVTKEV